MDAKRIADQLARTEGVDNWHFLLQQREETTIIRLPGIYTVRDGKLGSEPNPRPREVITAPSESAHAWLFSRFDEDGKEWRGDAYGQLTSDDPARVAPVLAALVGAARSQKNELFPLPGKDEPYPEVKLADPDLAGVDSGQLLARAQAFIDGIVAEAAELESVDVSNVELFITRMQNRLRTSAGVELDYPGTRLTAEVCFLARPGEDKVGEHTARLRTRRLFDLDPKVIVSEYGGASRDIALAGAPPDHQGSVVLAGEAAADFFTIGNSPIALHGGARAVHEKTSHYEKGKPVASGKVKGEPLNLVSDPLLPCGLSSTMFNQGDAGAARKVTVCRDGNWDTLFGGRRYYHYLGLLDENTPAPGQAGNTVVPAGSTAHRDLVTDDAVVVKAFSAFEVDSSSGQFSVEIRLGETRKDGEVKPFKGGLLVGNWFEAIGDVRFSKEVQVFCSFHGPRAVRFGNLKVAG